MREWILMQAQLQQDYASCENAVVLLELVEALYGESLTSGLMLCKAWTRLHNIEALEKRAQSLLRDAELQPEQRAALYYCLSQARWHNHDSSNARKAYAAYTSLISSQDHPL